MSKILVTGSTGNVGARVVRLLSSRGHAVRAFARDAERAKVAPNVEVAVGDFTDRASLTKAMEGVTHMFLLSAGHELEQHEDNAIDAAKAAGVGLVVKHSVAGAQYKASDIPRWHRAGEERLEASGVPYVFLRNASFASNAFGWAGTIKSQGTVYGALGEASLPVIDPEDIAEVAATVLTRPGHAGKAYELSGPESLTSEQQVNELSRAVGKPLKYVNVPDNAAKEAMLGMGMPAPYVDAMVNLIQFLRQLGRVEPTNDVKTLTGKQPRTFRQWAEANAGAFR
jgi:(4-alkanoyl-5-oxo-2,5-dihydrofuran-3-yl)methyl phosphate reductase